MLKAGIIGLPNVGKSTLFNAITNSSVEAANYPFATINPNVGIVELQDERLNLLAKILNSNKIIKSNFKFIDIAGLVKGASKGEGLGNQFLENIRQVDAIIHVIRFFEDKDIIHVLKKIDPMNDMEIINTELLLSDLKIIENILSKKNKLKKNEEEYLVAQKIFKHLSNEIPARQIDLEPKEKEIVLNWNLLTLKPILYVANIDEKNINNFEESLIYKKIKTKIQAEKIDLIAISIKIENEISQIQDLEEKKDFFEELQIKENGLNKLVKNAFKILKLSTFFTAGQKEIKSWTYKVGETAKECAGLIHSDIKKGFIKAEVISFKDYIDYNGEKGAKEHGKMRLEGKDYLVQEGDVIFFKFNI